jgi:hypothetical protein
MRGGPRLDFSGLAQVRWHLRVTSDHEYFAGRTAGMGGFRGRSGERHMSRVVRQSAGGGVSRPDSRQRAGPSLEPACHGAQLPRRH